MPLRKPFHITPQGGSILCLDGLAGRIFRACFANQCTYTGDLHSAKSFLNFIESKHTKFLPSGNKNATVSSQRKTTLKWNEDGSLSSIDMARILSRLGKKHLTECDFSCEWGNLNSTQNN